MIQPDLDTFLKKCQEGNLIPVWREILADMETPVSAFKKIGESRNAFLLESVEQGENLGRYSFLGCDPNVVFKCKGKEVQILYGDTEEDFNSYESPLDVLREFMARYKPVSDPNLPPFTGGAVGYLSYDMVRHWERLPDKNPDDLSLPDAFFCITDTLIAFDHVKHKMILISNAHVHGDPEEAYREATRKIDVLHSRLRKPLPAREDAPTPILSPNHRASTSTVGSNFSRAEFEQAVRRCKEYIAAGDIFQVVLSQRFQRTYAGDPLDLYRSLRAINPSPYMYYLQLGDLRIAGSSPEILIRYEDGEVTARPIAGTRPRGKNREEDLALEKDLLADPKERAEHVMLLDLGRNDVGRVSEYGSVQVTEFMVIERYSHVMHIVSNVTGRLRKGMDAFDVLRAGFPAGTVSGAPKIRAMEIIDEQENLRRGPYAGTVGYVSFNGNLDMAITIRTMVIKGSAVYVQAGAGIVADSIPASEYQETLSKARGMMNAVDMAEEGLD
ncbi:anthranilate synthase component I [Candidatus Sumerlaeota bacterium]|nr:anthranilate synthase component I [Candidatus Sumerlaeota bacterium]